MCVSFWTLFYSTDLYFYPKIISHLFNYNSFIVGLAVGYFFYKIVLDISFSLHFHINFRINLLISIKCLAELLVVTMMNLQVNLGRIGVNKY